MKILYNGRTIGSCDNRFNDKIWTNGSSDPRVRKSKSYAKSKRNKRIANFKNELKRTFALIVILALATGFIWLQLGGK